MKEKVVAVLRNTFQYGKNSSEKDENLKKMPKTNCKQVIFLITQSFFGRVVKLTEEVDLELFNPTKTRDSSNLQKQRPFINLLHLHLNTKM